MALTVSRREGEAVVLLHDGVRIVVQVRNITKHVCLSIDAPVATILRKEIEDRAPEAFSFPES